MRRQVYLALLVLAARLVRSLVPPSPARSSTKAHPRPAPPLSARGGLNILDEDAAEAAARAASPLIPRRGEHENYAAKWQARGSHYISYENLRSLNEKLAEGRTQRGGGGGSAEKRALLSEVMLTYFARFHNIIREEYQHEKRGVEERLVTWPLSRCDAFGCLVLPLLSSSISPLLSSSFLSPLLPSLSSLLPLRPPLMPILFQSLSHPMSCPNAIKQRPCTPLDAGCSPRDTCSLTSRRRPREICSRCVFHPVYVVGGCCCCVCCPTLYRDIYLHLYVSLRPPSLHPSSILTISLHTHRHTQTHKTHICPQFMEFAP